MNAIAHELDARLATLDAAKAASLERVVRDAIELASSDTPRLAEWPAGFFDRIRRLWGNDQLERQPHDEMGGVS